MKRLIILTLISGLFFYNLNAQDGGSVDCGLVAIETGNVFNCGPGQSAQIQVTITICGAASQGIWTVSHPDATNSFNFYAQANCPAPFNCGTSGQTLNFGLNYDCASFDPYTIIVTDPNGNTPCLFYDEPNCNAVNARLPIELIGFYGKEDGDDVVLNWYTASEINNEYFDLEYSYDGIHFLSAGKIAGAGNSISEKEYEFRHTNILSRRSGVIYYRLKQVDFDGKESISKLINIVPSNQVYMLKNLIQKGEDLEICGMQEIQDVVIVNTQGQLVFQQNRLEGNNQNTCINISTIALDKGLYYVVVNKSDTKKLLVQ